MNFEEIKNILSLLQFQIVRTHHIKKNFEFIALFHFLTAAIVNTV